MKSLLTLMAFVVFTSTFAQAPIAQPQSALTPTTGCISGNCNEGWGKWQFSNGSYEGFWENGKRKGYGIYDWDDFGVYVGFWVDDNMQGFGIYEDENGDMKKGMYENGTLGGLGEESDDGGWSWTAGKYVNHSLVTEYSQQTNDVTVGCTSGNCKDKYGTYIWDNGDLFLGFFLNSKPHLGVYVFSNGDTYQGMFNEKGQFHGQGIFSYESSSGMYAGDFQNGQFYGKGYYFDDYTTKIGVWENGNLTRSF
jgi:hypothetical protein